jgi:ABC-type amino acid transport substrate-binding protein
VALQRALDDALSRIRGDGRYAAIHRRWFGARSE